MQRGRFGVQIVAPRSIMACAKSPGRSAGTSFSRTERISDLGLRQRRSDLEQARHHPLDIAVDDRSLPVEGDRGDRRRRIGADPGQAAQSVFGVRKPAARKRRDQVGAFLQVAGARIVAEAGPGLHDVLGWGCGKRSDRRPFLDEFAEIRLYRLDRRLLQHDFRKPDMVRIGPDACSEIARRYAPGQVAMVGVVPAEQAGLRCRSCAFEFTLAGFGDGCHWS